MNIFNTTHIGLIATVILSVGVVSGCEYCQPLLIASISIMSIVIAIKSLRAGMSEDLIEIFSHVAQ